MLINKAYDLVTERGGFEIFLAIFLKARAGCMPPFLHVMPAFDFNESHAFMMHKVGAPSSHGMKTKLFFKLRPAHRAPNQFETTLKVRCHQTPRPTSKSLSASAISRILDYYDDDQHLFENLA